MTYNEFNARGLAYPVIELSKEQIEFLKSDKPAGTTFNWSPY